MTINYLKRDFDRAKQENRPAEAKALSSAIERREHPRVPPEAYRRFLRWQVKNMREDMPR